VTLAEILAALGGRMIVPDERHGWPSCPGCGVQTPPSIHGGRSYCYDCTCMELGFDAHDMAVCRAHGLTMKRWLEIGDETKLPSVTYRVWRRRTGR